MQTYEPPKRILAVIFDWAGTAVDFGSLAPMEAFRAVFAARGVEVTLDETRPPMGLHKRAHLRAMLDQTSVANKWLDAIKRPWTEADLDELYHAFAPYQLAAIAKTCDLVPELLECVAWLREREIRIGSTTGYFRAASELVAERAAGQGYVTDCNICADDVVEGRPAPWMLYRNLEQLGIYPPAAVVKVGDTVPDILEGRSAGAWSVGVLASSSEVGLPLADYRALPSGERNILLEKARLKLQSAGAHATIETMAELPALIGQIEQRLKLGERP